MKNNTIIYVAKAIVREIAVHDLYCCLLPQSLLLLAAAEMLLKKTHKPHSPAEHRGAY